MVGDSRVTLHRWIRDNNPIYHVYEQTNKYVSEDKDMSLIFTTRLPSDTVGDPRTYSDPNGASGPVCLNAELGAIIDTTHAEHGEKYNHDIVVKKIGNELNRYESDHRMKEPLLYPLLFPHGTPGYGFNLYFHQRETTRKKDGTKYHRRVTPKEYCSPPVVTGSLSKSPSLH